MKDKMKSQNKDNQNQKNEQLDQVCSDPKHQVLTTNQ